MYQACTIWINQHATVENLSVTQGFPYFDLRLQVIFQVSRRSLSGHTQDS